VLVTGSLIVLSFGCAKKESATPAASGVEAVSTQLKEAAAAETQKKLLEQTAPGQEKPMRNPFLTQEEEQEKELVGSGNRISLDYLILSAILYSSFHTSKAIIDGEILRIGDYVDNKEIVEIQPEAVILKDAQTQYIVKLTPPFLQKRGH
jgi:hypothetical protein